MLACVDVRACCHFRDDDDVAVMSCEQRIFFCCFLAFNFFLWAYYARQPFRFYKFLLFLILHAGSMCMQWHILEEKRGMRTNWTSLHFNHLSSRHTHLSSLCSVYVIIEEYQHCLPVMLLWAWDINNRRANIFFVVCIWMYNVCLYHIFQWWMAGAWIFIVSHVTTYLDLTLVSYTHARQGEADGDM